MRNFRLPRGVRGVHQISDDLRRDARRGAGYWRVLQRLIAVHAILRRLHGDVVAHAILWIQPERRRRLKAGAERNEKVTRHILGLQTYGLRARAIDVHVKSRFVESLLHVNVDGSWNMPKLICELFRDYVVAELVVSRNRDVNGSRRS